MNQVSRDLLFNSPALRDPKITLFFAIYNPAHNYNCAGRNYSSTRRSLEESSLSVYPLSIYCYIYISSPLCSID